LAAIVGDDCDGLPVVARQHALDHTASLCPEGDPITNLELEHLGVSLHLVKETKAFDDPMVEVDEFRFGQFIDVDWHEFPPSGLNQMTTYDDPCDAAKALPRPAPASPSSSPTSADPQGAAPTAATFRQRRLGGLSSSSRGGVR
jgi:hypothetical protein